MQLNRQTKLHRSDACNNAVGLSLLIFMQEIPTHVATKNARLWIDYTSMLQEEVVNKDGSIARLSLYQPMN